MTHKTLFEWIDAQGFSTEEEFDNLQKKHRHTHPRMACNCGQKEYHKQRNLLREVPMETHLPNGLVEKGYHAKNKKETQK